MIPRRAIGFGLYWPNHLTDRDHDTLNRLQREGKIVERCPEPDFWDYVILDESAVDQIPYDPSIVLRWSEPTS